MTSTDSAVLAAPESGFFALTDASGLIGFRPFGSDGRVPGGADDDSALGTGGGLRPDPTGKGLGREAIGTGLAFGWCRFSPPGFRVTEASFNQRALRVIHVLGFLQIASFEAATTGLSYVLLARPESCQTSTLTFSLSAFLRCSATSRNAA